MAVRAGVEYRRHALRGAILALLLVIAIALSPFQLRIQPFESTQAGVQSIALSSLSAVRLMPSVQNYLRMQIALRILGRTTSNLKKWPTHHIPVCWETPNPTFSNEMGWAQAAVKQSWQAHSTLTFDGWGACSDGASGVHIKVSDETPEAQGLGEDLDKETGGVLLNFVMSAVVMPCAQYRQACIETTAIHEFGHVIGLTHEDFNPGAPVFCAANASGPSGDKPLTPYDPKSVMGYCTLQDGNPHQLSALDIVSVNILYPPS